MARNTVLNISVRIKAKVLPFTPWKDQLGFFDVPWPQANVSQIASGMLDSLAQGDLL